MDQTEKIQRLEIDVERLKNEIAHIKALYESERATITRMGERLRNEIKIVDDKFDKALNGNNGNVGVKIRLDRIEQMKVFIGWMAGIIATVVAYLIYDWIKGK